MIIIEDKEFIEMMAAFFKAVRHTRDFPHPKLSIEQIRSEATHAESNAERVLGRDLWNNINKKAFKSYKY